MAELKPPRLPSRPRPERRRFAASSLLTSLNYAFEGVIHALRMQRNMRLHFAAAAFALLAGLALGVSRIELIALIGAAALVIVAEMMNTAIEAAIDIATSSFDLRAKIAKDAAAGAVLVASAVALLVAYLVFSDRVAHPTARAITRVRDSPVNISVAALIVTLILVMAGKALTNRGKPLSGGWPSGHAAIAFAACCAIVLVSAPTPHFVLIATLAFLMAALVAQTRVEAGIHTSVEVISGAVIGVLVTLALFQIWN